MGAVSIAGSPSGSGPRHRQPLLWPVTPLGDLAGPLQDRVGLRHPEQATAWPSFAGLLLYPACGPCYLERIGPYAGWALWRRDRFLGGGTCPFGQLPRSQLEPRPTRSSRRTWGNCVEDAVEHRSALPRGQRTHRTGVGLRVVEEVSRKVLGAALLSSGLDTAGGQVGDDIGDIGAGWPILVAKVQNHL